MNLFCGMPFTKSAPGRPPIVRRSPSGPLRRSQARSAELPPHAHGQKKTTRPCLQSQVAWCGRRDLNPYGLPHAPQTCAYAYSATTARTYNIILIDRFFVKPLSQNFTAKKSTSQSKRRSGRRGALPEPRRHRRPAARRRRRFSGRSGMLPRHFGPSTPDLPARSMQYPRRRERFSGRSGMPSDASCRRTLTILPESAQTQRASGAAPPRVPLRISSRAVAP